MSDQRTMASRRDAPIFINDMHCPGSLEWGEAQLDSWVRFRQAIGLKTFEPDDEAHRDFSRAWCAA